MEQKRVIFNQFKVNKNKLILGIFITIHSPMSYQNPHFVQQIVPNYVVRSQYLPTNQVVDASQGQASQWLKNYEQQKRQGRVFTQKPLEFNPNRYVSVRTYENVKLNQPISEQQFQNEISRVKRF